MEKFDFGRNLLNYREKKSLSQDALGALVGVSGAAIGRWEKNIDRPRQAKLVKLCSIFEITESELLGYSFNQLSKVEETRPEYGVDFLKDKIISLQDQLLKCKDENERLRRDAQLK